MKKACMDIETLSTTANSVVLSIGICFFDEDIEQEYQEIVDKGIEIFFDCEIQEGRHIMPSTLKWWEKQGADAQRVLNAVDTISPRDFHSIFETFCKDVGVSYNWVIKKCRWYTRGNHFDIAIMESLFSDFSVTPPWKYYNPRCVRTYLEEHGFSDNAKLVKPPGMIAHNALHDAAFDAWMMQQVQHHPLASLNIDKG